ncbi:MAG: dTDP-4-dehydrorhamnose reductase [Actinomycetota bacterium]
MERVLITGAKGRLGAALTAAAWPLGTVVIPATRDQVDLGDHAAVERYLRRSRPDVVINAAGYTDVDEAEYRPELAIRSNHRAVEHLVAEAGAVGARLVQLSTGYVFDGVKRSPYVEQDQVNPLGVYARSKRAGERAALAADDAVVIRTSWLYGAAGGGWLEDVRRMARDRPGFGVVNDRFGSPTLVTELAAAIVAAVAAGLDHPGLFHLAAPDRASWWDLADWILRLDGCRDEVSLRPLPTDQRFTAALRPVDISLASDRFAERYGIRLRPWRDALAATWPELSRRPLGPERTPATSGATDRVR